MIFVIVYVQSVFCAAFMLSPFQKIVTRDNIWCMLLIKGVLKPNHAYTMYIMHTEKLMMANT